MARESNDALADLANVYLGGFLCMSPNMFGFESGAENANASLTGIAIIVLALAAIYAHVDWEEWLNLALGIWVLVAPWVLHFASSNARTVHVIVGVLVAGLAAIELWIMHRPHEHAQTVRT